MGRVDRMLAMYWASYPSARNLPHSKAAKPRLHHQLCAPANHPRSTTPSKEGDEGPSLEIPPASEERRRRTERATASAIAATKSVLPNHLVVNSGSRRATPKVFPIKAFQQFKPKTNRSHQKQKMALPTWRQTAVRCAHSAFDTRLACPCPFGHSHNATRNTQNLNVVESLALGQLSSTRSPQRVAFCKIRLAGNYLHAALPCQDPIQRSQLPRSNCLRAGLSCCHRGCVAWSRFQCVC